MLVSRRAVLLGAVAVAAAACRGARHRAAPAVDPDAAALGAARQDERRLLADYDRAIAALAPAAAGNLTAARSAHAAHLTALGGTAPGPSPSPSPAGSGAYSSRLSVSSHALSAAERASASTLRAAAVAAQRGRTAALLASIAASHATLTPAGAG